MSSRIQLELSGKYSAAPTFKTLDSDVKNAQKRCKDFADAGRNVLSELSGVFSGQLNGAISSTVDLLGEITRGGIWGIVGAVAAQAIGFVVKKFTEAREAAEKVKKEYDEAAKKIGTASEIIGGKGADALAKLASEAKEAADRVESLRKVYYATQELNRQRDIYFGGTGADVDEEVRARRREDAEDDAARRIESAEERIEEAEKNERRVLRATVNARTAKRAGVAVDIDKAEKALADAQKATADARRELEAAKANADAVEAANQAEIYKEEYEKRLNAEKKEAADREAEKKEAEDREREEEKVRKARIEDEQRAKKAAEEKIKAEAKAQDEMLQKQIAGAKASAGIWEQNAQKVRGRTFNDVERARRDADRGGPSEFERQNAANERKAERLETDLRRGLHLSDKESAWLKRYKDWKDAQDPKNNKAAKEAERLEKQREQARQKMQRTLEQIHADLTKSLNVN